MKERGLLVLACALGFLGVAAGAFGAHALESRLDAKHLAWFDTGVRYQLVHAPMIALAAVLGARLAGLAFVAGVVVFSGTLYAMALGAPTWLGGVTPLGGLALLAGWVALAFSAPRAAAIR